MRTILCLGLLAAGLLTGCTTTYLEARGDSDICEIHHTFMRTDELPGMKVYKEPSREYIEARRKGFVHSYPFYLPYRSRTRYAVYLCDDCIRTEEIWKQLHSQSH
ncbi:MAG TPA: hypothetical protein VFC07_13815 [Verrucomicrobiae bacterium]|nr:hypothetical protein [Verrucomicrobiae bacterium]